MLMIGQGAGSKDGVRHSADALVGVLAGTAEQVGGLGSAQVVHCHENADCGGDPLMTGQRHATAACGHLEFIEPGCQTLVFHECGGVIDQQLEQC